MGKTMERLYRNVTAADVINITKWAGSGVFAALLSFFALQATVKVQAAKLDNIQSSIERIDRDKESKDSADGTRREVLRALRDIQRSVDEVKTDVRDLRNRRVR